MNDNLPPGYKEQENFFDYVWDIACEKFNTDNPTISQLEEVYLEEESKYDL